MNQTLLFDDAAPVGREPAAPASPTAPVQAAHVPHPYPSPKVESPVKDTGRRPFIALAAVALLAAAGFAVLKAGGPLKSAPAVAKNLSQAAVLAQNPADDLVERPRSTTADDLLAGNFASSAPEGRLMQLYATLAGAAPSAEGGPDALDQARQLSGAVPNFALAQLAYADLLNAQGRSIAGFGGLPAGQLAGSPERLDELLAEARARIDATAHRPPPGLVPEQLIYLSPSVRHAVAVDVARSRVYLFDNGPDGLVLRQDFYASIGKLGFNKRTEGDMRTPLGVYFVTGQLTKPRLSDRFGEKALTLNYPNQYDQMQGRTGSGIWMHGVQHDMFSRAPQATDGCVALSNIDLQALSGFVEKQGTPVVIADHLNWVKPGPATNGDKGFMKAFDAWRNARQTEGLDEQLKFYSRTQRTPAVASAGSWAELLRAEREKPGSPVPSVDNLSIVGFRDDGDMMIVTYSETGAGSPHGKLKRQYWAKEKTGWAIIYEGAIG